MQIIERQAQLLQSLAHASRDGTSLRAVAKENGWPPSSTFRLLRAMMDVGMVSQDPQTQNYRLGYQMLAFAGAYLERVGLTELIDPYLERLSSRTGMVSFAAIRDAETAICTSVRVPQDSTNFYVRVGRHLPLHASAGAKALFYDMENSRLEPLLAKAAATTFTSRTMTSVPEILFDLEKGAGRGYFTCDEEMEDGVWAAAAPIRTPTGKPVISLSILSLTRHAPGPGSPVEVLMAVTQEATQEIGAFLQSGQYLELV